jgi:hypothetical protein
MHTTLHSTLTTQISRLGYWAFCELLNSNTRIQSKRTVTIATGSLTAVSKRPSVALTTHPIYHRGYRMSTAIPPLPL